MYIISFVMLGGAVGAGLRYLVSSKVYSWFGIDFPWGTLFVNVIGSFAIGFFAEIFTYLIEIRELRVFLLIGLLGGFTTFSSYAYETINLLKDGETGLSILNIVGNNLLTLIAVLLGAILGRFCN